MCHQTRPWLGQITVCCLFGAEPLSDPMQAYCLLIVPLGTYFSEIFIKIQQFPLKKIHLLMFSVNRHLFGLSLNVLNTYTQLVTILIQNKRR